jgi:hypothetical protein
MQCKKLATKRLVHLTTTDMNRVGRLILNKGICNGKRIVPGASRWPGSVSAVDSKKLV